MNNNLLSSDLLDENRESGPKPNSIVELENLLGIALTERNLVKVASVGTRASLVSESYALNEQGLVIGLSFHNYKKAAFNFPLNHLESFNDLEYLSLTNCRVTNIDTVVNFKKIRNLFVGGNQIIDISSVSDLEYLEALAIWGNPISSVICLDKLTNLRQLYCQGIKVGNLDFLKNLKNLEELSVSRCGITSIAPIANLRNLQTLRIDDNNISDLTPLIGIDSLDSVDAENNSISHISMALAEQFSWLKSSMRREEKPIKRIKSISLENNPLVFPPSSVISFDSETVENYYRTTELFGYAPLSEGRIIVIGDGSAGKSSLIERILHNTFDEHKSQTNGVLINNLDLVHSDGRNLVLHIWDFGGQEIQHAVHRFFFTEGCLYLLVLDNRKEEEPEYWLQQIESLGGGAPVLIIFNKHDENAIEIADRKFLKEKYKNIVGFYNISCKTGFGLADFKSELQREAMNLRTIDEQFPNNWFAIKKKVDERTSGKRHYISYRSFSSICNENHVDSRNSKNLLLKYFNTIGVVTWFGETYLDNLNVLSPAWITRGVYKIITSKKTIQLFGHISIEDFKELLNPVDENDFLYSENHYDYILTMMKKFGLCYSADNKVVLLPSAFGKQPKLEYSDFKGEGIRTYILSFEEYMPIALIHRFISLSISEAYDKNYWYSGIVIKDSLSSSLAMVQADKEAKRIYVRIKGETQLGMWEHIRRDIRKISKDGYNNLPYTELIALDDEAIATVSYDDLISHLKANKSSFFHPKLQQDFPVGRLLGLFEQKELTINKFKSGEHVIRHSELEPGIKVPQFALTILNQTQNIINNNISIEFLHERGSDVKSEANYLMDELGNSNIALSEALTKLTDFIQVAKEAKSAEEVKEKGWGRKLKGVVETLAKSGDQLKKIKDGAEAMHTLTGGMHDIASHLNMPELSSAWHHLQGLFV